jgi:transposase InsO family protein
MVQRCREWATDTESHRRSIQGAKRRGKPWRTTYPNANAYRPADLVERDFKASRPDELWFADFTYLRCWEGVVYFAFAIDAYSRAIVGWQFAAHMRTDLVLDALREFRESVPLRCATRNRACGSAVTVRWDSTGEPRHG